MGTVAASYAPASSTGGVEDALKVSSLASATSSAEIDIGPRRIFEVWATQQINIKFGVAGLSAASANDWGLPANTVRRYETGEEFNAVRIFNNSNNPADVYLLRLNRGS